MPYSDINEVRDADGLRLVSVTGVPSPWSQAAKAMMEHKNLPFLMAAFEPMGENSEVTAWGGTNSAPIVAWNDQPPIDRWNDILILLERLGPDKPLVPDDAALRVQLFGLSHEICGELGLGWNRRLCQIQPAHDSGAAPPPLLRFAEKYGFSRSDDVDKARKRILECLNMLDQHLVQQAANGSEYFVGSQLSAVDFYWAAFSLLIKSRSLEDVPIAEPMQPLFLEHDPEFLSAFSPRLEAHRDRILDQHFRLPMEL